MPQISPYREERIDIHQEEMQDIITAVPSWMIRWGISLVLAILVLIGVIAQFIQYPDIVPSTLVVNSLNAPKSVISKSGGKLIKLLVKDKQQVKAFQPLAFMESTASAEDILKLKDILEGVRETTLSRKSVSNIDMKQQIGLRLGEIQSQYQNFYQAYLTYKDNIEGGFIEKKRAYLLSEIQSNQKLKSQILRQQSVQQKEYEIGKQQYEVSKQLAEKGVIAKMELKTAEAKLLSQSYPMEQSKRELLNNEVTAQAKQKEVLELENTVNQQKGIFLQALNTLLDATNQWIQQYVLRSPMNGTVQYVGVLQENQNLSTGQSVFIIGTGNTDYFGEVKIPQYNMGKIRVGQRVLVKFQSYPFEEYGVVKGQLTYMTDAPINDSVFVGKVAFVDTSIDKRVKLRNGMLADAQIVTEESTLLQRFIRNITKMMNQR